MFPTMSLSCLLLLLLQYVFVQGHPASQHERKKGFDWTITWEEHAPDGFARNMLLVNGQSPGPVLEVNQGDSVIVRLHNASPYNTTVHFHGIEMHGTPWSDGVPGVTQHAIQPGCSFKHEFKATQYGSYWYHSHFQGQIEDGLYGPIVIHPRPHDPKPFHKVSNSSRDIRAMKEAEQQVTPLIISDFVHLTSQEKWDMTLAAGFEDTCYDSILFNGKGSVQCLDADVVEANLNEGQKAYLAMVPGSSMTDKACFPGAVLNAFGGGEGDESALLPGSFTGCKNTQGSVEVIKASKSSCSGWIAIDIIGAANFMSGAFSIDQHDMWVYAVDGSYVEPQKVQAIVVSNGDRYSVLVKTRKAGDYKIRFHSVSAPQMMTGHAILSVDGAKNQGHDSEPYINLVGLPTSKDVVFFDQHTAVPFPPDPIPRTADAFFRLNMKVDGPSYLWAMNSTRLMPMNLELMEPVLFNPNPDVHNNVTISTENNTWVDLVFYAAAFPMPPHPIHKHGNKMYQVGAGTGPFEWSSVDEAIKDIPEQFNLVNPPRRDTFSSPPAQQDHAWTAVRYHVTNPGAWLLHCHIANHMMGGMVMVIQDGVDQWPEIPEEYLNYGS